MKFSHFLQESVITIPVTRLFGWNPKATEALQEVRDGKLSYSKNQPLQVSRLDNPKGGFIVMDGYHRAFESILAGQPHVTAMINQYVPRIERSGAAFADQVARKIRLTDLVKSNASPAPPQR